MVAPELIAEVTELRARCADLESQVERLRRLYLQTLEQVKKLERGIIGPKTEKAPPHPAQLTLDVLGTLLREHGADPDAIAAAAEQQSQQVKKPRQKPTGRKPLPAELPRVDIEVLPPEPGALPDAEKQALRDALPLADQQMALAMVKRDAWSLSKALEPLAGSVASKWIFGIGVLLAIAGTVSLVVSWMGD